MLELGAPSFTSVDDLRASYALVRARLSQPARKIFDPEEHLRRESNVIDMRKPWRAPVVAVMLDWSKSEQDALAKRQGFFEVAFAGSAAAIIQETAEHYGFSAHDLKGPWRQKLISHARHVACWKLRQPPPIGPDRPLSFPQIGRIMGGRDHTTALSSYRKIQSMIDRGIEI